MQKHLLILIASACLVLAACTSKEPAGRGGAGVPAIPVTTALVEPMQWVDTIEAVVEVTEIRPTSKSGRAVVTSRIDVFNHQGVMVMTYTATRLLAGRS